VSSDHSDDCDQRAFEVLCEETFSVKPAVSKLGCRRLGKRIDGQQPRKLLVHLDSEQSASTLLAEARKLRKSNSEVVAKTIYLNPDLSPAELKLAYDRRQKRRARAQQQREQDEQYRQLDYGQINPPTTSVPEFQCADFPPLSATISDSADVRTDSTGSTDSLFRTTASQ